MRIISLVTAATMVMSLVEARFVSQMSRNHARHIKHKMEREFGPGLKHLFHPVTHEFNHAAVIERRGGRKAEEYIGTEKGLGIHQTMSWLHGLYGSPTKDKNRKKHVKNVKAHPQVRQDDFGSEDAPEDADNSEAPEDADGAPEDADAPKENTTPYPELWMQLGDHNIDQYSWVSFMYGWSKGLMKDPFSDDAVVSSCYEGLFELITEGDFFVQDIMVLEQTLKIFDFLVYYPAKILKSGENVYEQCGGYNYLIMLSLIFAFDYGYIAELVTRLSLIISDEFQGFLTDMYELFEEEYTDWYYVGFRVGLFWKKVFDVELLAE